MKTIEELEKKVEETFYDLANGLNIPNDIFEDYIPEVEIDPEINCAGQMNTKNYTLIVPNLDVDESTISEEVMHTIHSLIMPDISSTPNVEKENLLYKKILNETLGHFASKIKDDNTPRPTLADWKKTIDDTALLLETLKETHSKSEDLIEAKYASGQQPSEEILNAVESASKTIIKHSNLLGYNKTMYDIGIKINSTLFNANQTHQEKFLMRFRRKPVLSLNKLGIAAMDVVLIKGLDEELRKGVLETWGNLEHAIGYNLGAQLYNHYKENRISGLTIVCNMLQTPLEDSSKKVLEIYRELYTK